MVRFGIPTTRCKQLPQESSGSRSPLWQKGREQEQFQHFLCLGGGLGVIYCADDICNDGNHAWKVMSD